MTDRITIRNPDDWHLHVRDGAMLKASLPGTAPKEVKVDGPDEKALVYRGGETIEWRVAH